VLPDQVRVVRIFNTYGPHMALDDGRVVSNFVAQALTGQPMTIYGDGTQTRSFQYVSDLIEGARWGLGFRVHMFSPPCSTPCACTCLRPHQGCAESVPRAAFLRMHDACWPGMRNRLAPIALLTFSHMQGLLNNRI
jgi:hypothetical protein